MREGECKCWVNVVDCLDGFAQHVGGDRFAISRTELEG